MENFRDKFVDEANDLINDLEKTLLELEANPTNMDVIQSVFRVMHSLKGGSAMFGFHKMDKFTHYLENIYDLIRNDKLKVDSEILNVTLSSVDHLRNLLQEQDDTDTTNESQNQILMSRIAAIIEKNGVQDPNAPAKPVQPEPTDAEVPKTATYYISFKPHPNIFNFGTNPLYLIDELCDLGEAKVVARTGNIPSFDELKPNSCYTYWDVFLATNAGINLISEVFIFVDDQCDLTVRKISEINLFKEKSFNGIIDETVNSGKDIDIDQLLLLTSELEKVYQKQKMDSAAEKSNAVNIHGSTISSIRVSSEKLDNLINWVSELVTIQARLSLFAQESNIPGLVPMAEEVEKISRRLRDDVFSIRLIPIENMVTRFQRLVRELSQELGKDVAFKGEGTDTELDKNIIESLNDPLMHIIRNSMDHGIEDAEPRRAMGKPAKATILLKAYYSGANVIIQVTDDGQGMDPEKIRNKAIMKGLILPDSQLSDKDIIDLVFQSGFSTASKVTKVSGRGVGMDVVKRKISEIRGEVDIDTHVGKGTSITIKLPLTLSIIDGLLVKVADTKYVIPLSSVKKCYEFKHAELTGAVNNLIRTDNKETAFISFRDVFNIPGDPPEQEHVVVVQYGDMSIGIAIDDIIGQYQAVLKPLGRLYREQQTISGATILGDGTVALVVDTNKLIAAFSLKDRINRIV